MEFGITMFPTDLSIGPIELARACEERGFVSLYVPEHTHIPTSRATPAPAGEPLAEEYKRSLDPFVTLTAAAAVTEHLRVGTGIALVAQRDPIVTAKEVASLDLVSGGRFVFGIGFGWNVEELADHGVAFADRRAVVAERIAAMKALWTEDEGGLHGGVRGLPAVVLVAETGAEAASADPARWGWRARSCSRPLPPTATAGCPSVGPACARRCPSSTPPWRPPGGTRPSSRSSPSG